MQDPRIQRFKDRLKTCTMTIVHADGVYRHLCFRNSNSDFPGNCAFNVVTWPGYACIYGDWFDSHVITCEHDMLTEFLNVSHIPYEYWEKKMKLAGRHQTLRETSAEACDQWLDQHMQDLAEEWPHLTEDELHDIRDEYESCFDANDILVWQQLEELGDFTTKNHGSIPLAISDAQELSLTEYTDGFLIACKGLRFAAKQWAKHQTQGD